jgi:hypothetical protein
MGLELKTSVVVNGERRARASVHLDSKALRIGGRPVVEVPLAEVKRVEVRGATLSLSTRAGAIQIDAGEQAAAWAAKIRAPPSRAKKLGLKAGLRIGIHGLEDPALVSEIEEADAVLTKEAKRLDLVFLGVASERELSKLGTIAKALAPHGGIWVVRTKGRDAAVSEGSVRTAAERAGLVDVKVVAYSDTQSADKLVIPVNARPKG